MNDLGNITSFAQGEGPMVAILREKNVAYARLRIMPEKLNSSQKESQKEVKLTKTGLRMAGRSRFYIERIEEIDCASSEEDILGTSRYGRL